MLDSSLTPTEKEKKNTPFFSLCYSLELSLWVPTSVCGARRKQTKMAKAYLPTYPTSWPHSLCPSPKVHLCLHYYKSLAVGWLVVLPSRWFWLMRFNSSFFFKKKKKHLIYPLLMTLMHKTLIIHWCWYIIASILPVFEISDTVLGAVNIIDIVVRSWSANS